MLKISWKIAPEEQFCLLSIIFCYLILDFHVKTRIKISLRDKRLFEITEVEITRVDYMCTLFRLRCMYEYAQRFHSRCTSYDNLVVFLTFFFNINFEKLFFQNFIANTMVSKFKDGLKPPLQLGLSQPEF